MNRLLIAFPLVLFAAACGDDNSPTLSSSTTAPSPTTTAVTVTVTSPVRMGQTAQATGSETLSDGQSRAITSGWLSDAAAIATVTNAGLVTGVSNGRATIYVIAGGRQGQQVVRVVPDYHGRWSGGLRVTSCTQTGVFASAGFCDDFRVGQTYRYALSLTQSGEQMTAIVDYGTPWLFPSVAAPIREDGSSAFAASMNAVEPELGLALSLEPAFTINSTRAGELTGTVNEVWRLPNFPGEGRLTQEVVSTTRSSTAALSSISEGEARRPRFPRKLTMQKR
jgi:hypothetical protein